MSGVNAKGRAILLTKGGKPYVILVSKKTGKEYHGKPAVGKSAAPRKPRAARAVASPKLVGTLPPRAIPRKGGRSPYMTTEKPVFKSERGSLFTVAPSGKRQYRKTMGVAGVGSTGKANVRGNPILMGPRGGLYIVLADGKKRKPYVRSEPKPKSKIVTVFN